jgi:hypothetical protein
LSRIGSAAGSDVRGRASWQREPRWRTIRRRRWAAAEYLAMRTLSRLAAAGLGHLPVGALAAARAAVRPGPREFAHQAGVNGCRLGSDVGIVTPPAQD